MGPMMLLIPEIISRGGLAKSRPLRNRLLTSTDQSHLRRSPLALRFFTSRNRTQNAERSITLDTGSRITMATLDEETACHPWIPSTVPIRRSQWTEPAATTPPKGPSCQAVQGDKCSPVFSYWADTVHITPPITSASGPWNEQLGKKRIFSHAPRPEREELLDGGKPGTG